MTYIDIIIQLKYNIIMKQFTPIIEVLTGLLMIVGLYLYGNTLLEIPILGFFLAMFGWIIPIVFIWGGIDRYKKIKSDKFILTNETDTLFRHYSK